MPTLALVEEAKGPAIPPDMTDDDEVFIGCPFLKSYIVRYVQT